jgi:hypothetical protein
MATTTTNPIRTTNDATTTTPTVYDPTNDIKALGAAQKAAAIAALGASHDKSLSDLSAANAKIEPAYYDQRNSTSTDNQIAAKNFAEYAASKGENNANGMNGSLAQSNIASNLSLQGNLGNLAKGEAGAYADNAKQVADVNTAYNNDVASTSAGIDATNMQSVIAAQQAYNAAKLAQANTDRGYNYQVGRDTVSDTGYSNGVQTLAGKTTEANIDQAKASTANTIANTEYQKLVTANYPAEQAAKMAQAAATLKGQNLQNDYQTAVNAGYPQQEAMDLAYKAAQINATNASAAASNRSGYGGSGGGSSSSSKASTASNTKNIEAAFMEQMGKGTAADWLDTNSDEIIQNIGLSEYNAMAKQAKDDAIHQSSLRSSEKNSSKTANGGGGRMLAPT